MSVETPSPVVIEHRTMESLSPECTPLKHAYDSCFNTWFEGYLKPAVVAADQQKQAGLEATPTATAARPIAAAAGVAADGSRPSVVGQDSRTRLSTGGKTREEEKPRSISLIPSLAIDPPTTSRPRTTIDARGHVVSQKVSPRPIESVVIAAAAADDDGSLSGDANKPQESPPSTWTNSLFSLLLPTHRASLSEGHAASDLSVREDTRSHPDLWPFRSAAASRSRSGAAGSKNLHPGIQDDTLADDEDEEDDDDGEISPEDVKLVLEEFGEEEPTTTTAGAPLSSEPVEATIINPAKMQAERAQAMRDEYEAKCGSLWKEYRACVQRAIDGNQVLGQLLEQARSENPIEKAVPLEGGGFGAPGAEP